MDPVSYYQQDFFLWFQKKRINLDHDLPAAKIIFLWVHVVPAVTFWTLPKSLYGTWNM